MMTRKGAWSDQFQFRNASSKAAAVVALKLYAHPFSSYCQKVLIALWENDIPFEYCLVAPENPQAMVELEALWPFKRFPVLADNGRPVREASIIIEHLARFHPGPVQLIPEDAGTAIEVRFMDRFFDLYIHTPLQKIVFDTFRPKGSQDWHGVAEAHQSLDVAYRWLDGVLQGREWAVGDDFSLADCSAAPALFYSDWAHPIDAELRNVKAYRQRLLARPSFARAVEEGRPYRAFFPLDQPDRD